MGQKDIVSKHAIRHIAIDVARLLLKLDIDADSLELLNTEQQRVEDRRADLVAKVRERGNDQKFILHIEIQNNNQRQMPWRMLRYLTDIRLTYPDYPVRQYVIFIGKERLTMPEKICEKQLQYEYMQMDMSRVDCATLLEQGTPDALVLAILCDFGPRKAREVIEQILLRLKEQLNDEPKRFREYLDMLEILSDNRDLKDVIKEAELMLTQVDVERLPSYELGMEKGMEKGMERLHEKICQEKRRLAISLLDLLTDEVIAEKMGLTLVEVQKLRTEIPSKPEA